MTCPDAGSYIFTNPKGILAAVSAIGQWRQPLLIIVMLQRLEPGGVICSQLPVQTNFRVTDIIADGKQVRIEDLFSGERKNVAMSELVSALFRDDLRFEIEGKQAKLTAADALSTEYQYLSLDDCPDRLVRPFVTG